MVLKYQSQTYPALLLPRSVNPLAPPLVTSDGRFPTNNQTEHARAAQHTILYPLHSTSTHSHPLAPPLVTSDGRFPANTHLENTREPLAHLLYPIPTSHPSTHPLAPSLVTSDGRFPTHNSSAHYHHYSILANTKTGSKLPRDSLYQVYLSLTKFHVVLTFDRLHDKTDPLDNVSRAEFLRFADEELDVVPSGPMYSDQSVFISEMVSRSLQPH